jgi:hypothetical protein
MVEKPDPVEKRGLFLLLLLLLVRCWLADCLACLPSSAMNEQNRLLHLWTNETLFFFIYERIEHTFSSLNEWNILLLLSFFFISERMKHTSSSSMNEWNSTFSSSMNEWNVLLLLHLWTNGTSFSFISERMKQTSFIYEWMELTFSSSMNEWNVLLLHLWTNETDFFHLWMNGTSFFFFIDERMERPSSSSSMNEWNALFLHLYERMECTSSSSMNEWNTHFFIYGQMNHSDWLIDTHWMIVCRMDVWMDDTLKSFTYLDFLVFLQEQFSLQSKEITLQNGWQFVGIVSIPCRGKHQFVWFCNVPIKFPRSQCVPQYVPNSITLISIYGGRSFCLFCISYCNLPKQMVLLVVLFISLESTQWVQVHYVGFCKIIWKFLIFMCKNILNFE